MPITLNDIKTLSTPKKVLLAVGFGLLFGYFYWFYFLQANVEKRSALKEKLVELNQQIAEKERIAARKERFMQEVRMMREAFRLALAKLPDKREIPGLFHAVSLAGRESGMEFLLFEPKPPEKAPPPKDASGKPDPAAAKAAAQANKDKFYEEIPVKVIIGGRFVNTVSFFDRIARLPRIVNVEEISMGDGKDIPGKGRVVNTSCVIKTYMFVEKAEGAAKKPDEPKK